MPNAIVERFALWDGSGNTRVQM